jgi:arginyl-tRNA synthetase
VGNFALKLQRIPDWTHSSVITGSEQREYFAVLQQVFWEVFSSEMEHRVFTHIATGFLTLTTGKMSSRTGNVLTGEDIIADLQESAKARAAESRAEDIEALSRSIAVAALKYEVLKQASDKNIIFDKERALRLDGDSGPYLQYTHARACAIVARATDEAIIARAHGMPPSDIARLVHRFPEVVQEASVMAEPHIITTYITQLAGAFNSWYGREQILDGTPAAAHKVALTDAVRKTLKNGLWILGIPAPEKM